MTWYSLHILFVCQYNGETSVSLTKTKIIISADSAIFYNLLMIKFGVCTCNIYT